MNTSIEWLFPHGPIADDRIEFVEGLFGIVFPHDYVECAKNYHGGHPNLEIYDFGEHTEAVFNSLLGFKMGESNYILDVYNNVKDRMVSNVFPFADDPFGNLICFDYRKSKKDNPTVVFWDHEIAFNNTECSIIPLCNSFSDLLAKLYSE